MERLSGILYAKFDRPPARKGMILNRPKSMKMICLEASFLSRGDEKSDKVFPVKLSA